MRALFNVLMSTFLSHPNPAVTIFWHYQMRPLLEFKGNTLFQDALKNGAIISFSEANTLVNHNNESVFFLWLMNLLNLPQVYTASPMIALFPQTSNT